MNKMFEDMIAMAMADMAMQEINSSGDAEKIADIVRKYPPSITVALICGTLDEYLKLHDYTIEEMDEVYKSMYETSKKVHRLVRSSEK